MYVGYVLFNKVIIGGVGYVPLAVQVTSAVDPLALVHVVTTILTSHTHVVDHVAILPVAIADLFPSFRSTLFVNIFFVPVPIFHLRTI
jgi:hypothetical protein